MTTILDSNPNTGVKLWTLIQTATNEEFNKFWIASDATRRAVTALLSKGLSIQFGSPDSNYLEVWAVHRMAQRLLVHFGQLKQLDMSLLQENLEKIINTTDITKLPLETEASLGNDGDVFCWALFVLLRLEIGDKQKYAELGRQIFIHVPNLDEQLRTDIIKYYMPYVRSGTSPRWLIEATLKGVEFKDGQTPNWAMWENKDLSLPHIQTSKLLQKEIETRLTELGVVHEGFCHCDDRRLGSYSRIGTFYRLLLALCKNGDQIRFWLSEVGPYVYMQKKTSEDYVPDCVKKLTPNSLSSEELMELLAKVSREKGAKVTTDPELDVNLSHYTFKSDLGYVGNFNKMAHDIYTLLYICTD
eukprot:Phypoly_transcript_11138.p1 GENE.Phypoly_transcript_11138~~Phypoly_transcript_11138.p1  ORF type:complete len:408 (+),score=45.12 Phypoly_transcript_11138:153-1226(+)